MNKAQEYDSLSDWYDTLWPGRDDFPFYLDMAQRYGSPILELGCGTGRITCELAKHGYQVTGIDISPKMLQKAHARKADLDTDVRTLVEFHQGSMTNFDLPQCFGLIIAPFSSILELSGRNDRVATYKCCFRHLTEKGAFTVDNWFRGTGALADWGKPRPSKVLTFLGIHKHPTQQDVGVQHFEAQDYGPDDLMSLTILLDTVNSEGTVRRRTFTLERHYASPEQTKAELVEAGFKDIEMYGGFNREPMYDEKLIGKGRQIFVAKH
jgi:SAM-dependent methyltransferase